VFWNCSSPHGRIRNIKENRGTGSQPNPLILMSLDLCSGGKLVHNRLRVQLSSRQKLKIALLEPMERKFLRLLTSIAPSLCRIAN
jgi:hypothetical protein